MVCKEDVVSWFKSLKSHTRIDVMCNLFNLCLPFELRFLGTCLEDLGKRDFHDLRTTESGANNPSEFKSPDLQCISDKRARTKLALHISLLHSCNYACSNGYYKILANVEEVNNLIKCNGVSSADDEVLEELLLIYTLALNHPAFTFEQKLFLGEVFTKLQQEEERRNCVKRTRPRSIQGSTGGDVVDKPLIQAYPPPGSPEQPLLVPPVCSASHCPPITPAALTGDPLVSMADPLLGGYVPYSLMPGYPTMMLPPQPPEQRSPMVSRTSSPCQSNSPSRAGSPGRPKPLPTSFTRPPPIVTDPPPPPHIPYLPPKYASWEQLRQCTDDELREHGFNTQSISQLRTLDSRHHSTNGYNLAPKKPPPSDPDKDSGGAPLRRFNSVDSPSQVFSWGIPQCITCVMSLPRQNAKSLPPHIIHNFKCVSLDQDTGSALNSSASDSASDHSPPDTPSLTTTNDRVLPLGPSSEMWEEQRIPELTDDRRVVVGQGRGRGMNRSNRSNPPGIPTQSRGRGHNPPHRRDNNSANGSLDDRKVFAASDSGVGMAFPYSTQFLPQNQYIPAYPTFTSQSGLLSLPFPHHNREMLFHPLPPPQPFITTRPALPSHLPYSPLVPPPKISCFNCGSHGHLGSDCQEATIEEITNKGQYRIDYSNSFPYPKPGECSTAQDK